LLKSKLKGFAKHEVKRVTKGTETLGGKFTITINNEPIEMTYDYHPDHLKANISALTSINSESIVVTRGGVPAWGAYWKIEFHGVHSKPVIAQSSLTSLTKDANVSLTFNVTEIQAVSKNYLYVPISSDFLYTLETKPTV
jgi:hypothetical protein